MQAPGRSGAATARPARPTTPRTTPQGPMHAAAPKKPRVALTLLGCDASGQIGGAEQFFARLADAYARAPGGLRVHFATMADAARVLRRRGLLRPRRRARACRAQPSGLEIQGLRRFGPALPPAAARGFDLGTWSCPRPSTPRPWPCWRGCPGARPGAEHHRLHRGPPLERPHPPERPAAQGLSHHPGLVPFDGLYSWYTLFCDAVGAGPFALRPTPGPRRAPVFTDPVAFAPAPVKERPSSSPRGWCHEAPGAVRAGRGPAAARRPGLAAGGASRSWATPHARGPCCACGPTPGWRQQLGFAKATIWPRSSPAPGLFVSCQDYETSPRWPCSKPWPAPTPHRPQRGPTGQYVTPRRKRRARPGTTPRPWPGPWKPSWRPAAPRAWGRESRRLATEVHTEDAFVQDVEAFWTDVLARRARPAPQG
jgi:hypothetical protein